LEKFGSGFGPSSSSRSSSGSRLIKHSFSKTKFTQNLAFSIIEVALFSRQLALIFDYLPFVFYCMLDPGPNPVPEPLFITVQVPIPLRQKVADPVVSGPVRQHCF
jgi:hypothetical protein